MLKNLFSRERRSQPLTPSESLSLQLERIFGSSESVGSVEGAMKIVAVNSAVTFIADQIAALPLHVYKENTKLDVHPVAKKIRTAINAEYMTMNQFLKTMTVSYLLRGRALAHIEFDGLGEPVNIRPMSIDAVKVELKAGKKVYIETFANGKTKTYKPSEVIDVVQTLKFDGLTHHDVLFENGQSLKRIQEVEKLVAKTFGSGGIPPLQLITSKEYGGVANQKRAAQAAEREVAESGNGKFIVPPADHKFEAIGLDPAALQMMEARKWGLLEICRIFKLPPQFLQDLSFGTYSNTEQQSLNLVKFLLQPIAKAFEAELTLKLFGIGADEYAKFNFGSLLRGDFNTQVQALSRCIMSGIMMPNEVRGLLEMPPVENGDHLFIQGANETLENIIKDIAQEANNGEQN